MPGANDDLKYHYVQGLAMHYLLTGDDRFREAAEDVAARAASLWPSPGYAGGADFWTERHAGFGLLAYVWVAMVSDDEAATYVALADDAVTAYLDVQATYPAGYDDEDARCFAHHADAHGESYGYFGCSPWMSAILADAMHAYAELRGGANAPSSLSMYQAGAIESLKGAAGLFVSELSSAGFEVHVIRFASSVEVAMNVDAIPDEFTDQADRWTSLYAAVNMAFHHYPGAVVVAFSDGAKDTHPLGRRPPSVLLHLQPETPVFRGVLHGHGLSFQLDLAFRHVPPGAPGVVPPPLVAVPAIVVVSDADGLEVKDAVGG